MVRGNSGSGSRAHAALDAPSQAKSVAREARSYKSAGGALAGVEAARRAARASSFGRDPASRFAPRARTARRCAWFTADADRPCQRGFTLVELMITLAIAAALTMIAVPNFRHLMVSMRLSDLNSALAGDLQYARTEAIARQVNIEVGAPSGDWQGGWTVSIPPPSPSTTVATVVLRRHPAVPAQYTIDAAPAGSVVYRAQGMLASAAARFTLSAPRADNTPVFLQVASSGTLQPTTGTDTAPSACPEPSP